MAYTRMRAENELKSIKSKINAAGRVEIGRIFFLF